MTLTHRENTRVPDVTFQVRVDGQWEERTSDDLLAATPGGLHPDVLQQPREVVEKVDFELMSLLVSAINGCGMCMDAHVAEVLKAGVWKQGVQSTIGIAAVLRAASQTLSIKASHEH
ncbi:MAG: carboxymuconolactone decarboxylase family protein [Myxococcales bacterium]|nr:carboxymuconolactone decarboxylase family protein [Myxococcales bacterium]